MWLRVEEKLYTTRLKVSAAACFYNSRAREDGVRALSSWRLGNSRVLSKRATWQVVAKNTTMAWRWPTRITKEQTILSGGAFRASPPLHSANVETSIYYLSARSPDRERWLTTSDGLYRDWETPGACGTSLVVSHSRPSGCSLKSS